MNNVTLIGRLTRDPEIRYTNDQMAVATFSVAIDRPPKKDGTKEADFPRITVFGKQAENCEKYLKKGRLVGIVGRIQTGSYTNKNGEKVYTTDVVADRVEFLEWGNDQQQAQGQQQYAPQNAAQQQYAPQPQPAPMPQQAPAQPMQQPVQQPVQQQMPAGGGNIDWDF